MNLTVCFLRFSLFDRVYTVTAGKIVGIILDVDEVWDSTPVEAVTGPATSMIGMESSDLPVLTTT